MNIIYLGAFRLPIYDAAAARVLNMAKAIRDGGHRVTLFSWGGRYRQNDKTAEGNYYVDGFRYIITNELDASGGFVSRVKGRLTRGETTKNLLSHWPDKIDAIIAYNGSLINWLITFCRHRDIKLINDMTEWYSNSELRLSERIPYLYSMSVIQKRVKNKIVISSYLDKYYSMTHNVIVPATCDISESKWKENLDYARGVAGDFYGITLIYAGNPAHKDQVHHVINAVQHLLEEGTAIRFLILGTTRESYLSNYSVLLKTRELHRNIVFLGQLSQEVIPSFYHLADFMVLLREQTRKSNAGFPTKFAESFISGTPVIANLTSDLGLFLKDGENGFVVEEPSEQAVYRTLKERVVGMSRDQITSMKASVKMVSGRFDYHAYVEPISEFMDSLK